jgi:hypothetical protein
LMASAIFAICSPLYSSLRRRLTGVKSLWANGIEWGKSSSAQWGREI